MDISICGHQTYCNAATAPIQVSLYDTIGSVSAADWLRFIPDGNPLLNPSYLHLLEETQKGEMEFIYALLRNADGLLGVCYFQVVHFKGSNLVPYFDNI